MFRLAFVLVIAVMAAEMSEAQAGPATLVCNNGTQKFIAKGTAFFLGYPVPGSQDRVFPYLVTNWHVALCFRG